MWIVILNFCLFVLLVSVFIYGLKHWRNLINIPDEEETPAEKVDGFYNRLPFWILVISCGLYSLFSDILSLLG